MQQAGLGRKGDRIDSDADKEEVTDLTLVFAGQRKEGHFCLSSEVSIMQKHTDSYCLL